ncbi:HEAT repeat domain-containing protein, partial [Roseobacter sp.]
LRSALADEFWQVRVKAVRSLGKLGATEAAVEIAPMMDLSIPNLRKECAAVLGEMAVVETLPYLEKYVDDPDPDVRKNVRWAMGRIAA